MRNIAKTMAALGVLGAAALGAPTTASAQGIYFQGPGFDFGVGPRYDDRYYGRAYREPRWQNRRYEARPRYYQRGWGEWDRYGRRWDNFD
jgi:hypothetical protein